MAMEGFNEFINLTELDNTCTMNHPSSYMEYLSRSSSDHVPMVMWLDRYSECYGPSLFRFQQMWTRLDDFLNSVKKVWAEEVPGNGLWKLAGKLKKLRVVLKRWNVNVFGWTNSHIAKLEKEIVDLDCKLQEGGTEEDKQAFCSQA